MWMTQSLLLSLRSSLWYCHSLSDVFASLLMCSIRLYTGNRTCKFLCVVYLGIICFADAVSKNWKIFRCYLFVSFVCLSSGRICFCCGNYYSPLHKYVCIIEVADTLLQHCSLEFNFTICIVSSARWFIHLNVNLVLNFYDWFLVLSNKFMTFRCSILSIYL